MVPELQIDLDLDPPERWREVQGYAKQAQRLTDSYVKDLGGLELFASMIDEYRTAFVSPEYGAEIDAVAALIDRRPEEVLIANLYYDAFRAILGCTAFALDTPEGPLHARNLDWWTEKNYLCDFTTVMSCSGGKCPTPYKIVGWPGFIGVFSGMATDRFAITLNAVVSADTPQLAQSITLLLRSVFDSAPDYDNAVSILTETPIAADCLLLVTGTKTGEMVVIERTSTRAELRRPENGMVVVTNDYRALDSGFAPAEGNVLQETACARFDQATRLCSQHRPANVADCFSILENSDVKMGITVQHMAMRARTGELEVRLPGSGIGRAFRKVLGVERASYRAPRVTPTASTLR